MAIDSLPGSARAHFALMLITTLALALGGAALAEWKNLAACPLCIVQRMLYLLLAALGAIGLLAAGSPPGRRLLGLLALVTAGTGAGVAGYQVWLQRYAPMTTCSGQMSWWEELVDRAGEAVPFLFRASGSCTDRAWTVFGLSIADWSLICFGGFSLLALRLVFKRLRA